VGAAAHAAHRGQRPLLPGFHLRGEDMKNWLVALVLLLVLPVAHAEKLGFETIVLEWPAGYEAQAGENSITMTGPDGEHVTILQFSLDDGTSDEEAQAKTATLREFAETEMPKSAAEQGASIVRDLKKTDFDNRHTLYSMVSERGADTDLQYLIEYFLVGARGGAYFSIVGSGGALPAIATFDPVFAGVRWKE
jgi:hypothetical protein